MRLLLLATLLAGRAMADPTSPAALACYDNLCGMDSYCACHQVGGGTRCWSTRADCDVDRACCVSSGKCDGMKQDACTSKTSAERKQRDRAAKR